MSCNNYNKYNILSIDDITETSPTNKIESTELEHPKITILKRERKQWTESSSTPMTILPERVDKPNSAESPKSKMILPEKVDMSKASPRNWMNTVDPWTSQWVKKVVDQDDQIRSLKHMQSFIHDSRTEEVSPRLIQQLREMTDLEAQFTLRELQQKPRFMQRKRSQNAFKVKANIQTPAGEVCKILALLDSGCTGTTMDQQFTKEKGLETHKLPRPIPVYNADGSINQAGSITEFAIVELMIDDHKEQIAMGLSQLSTHTIFLGYDWLQKHNLIVNWREHTLKFTCDNDHIPNLVATDDDDKKEEERLFAINLSYLRNLSTEITIQLGKAKRAQTFEEIVPEAYHEFKDMFNKETFDELPPRRPWDHAIKLLPGDHKVDCKTYNLTSAEQKELDEFLEENLKTGRICPSKSPFASAFFFIKKKDGKL